MIFKSGRGGAREGAGRPKGIRKKIKSPSEYRQTIGVRLPAWIVDWIKAHPDPAGRIIENAILKTYKIKKTN